MLSDYQRLSILMDDFWLPEIKHRGIDQQLADSKGSTLRCFSNRLESVGLLEVFYQQPDHLSGGGDRHYYCLFLGRIWASKNFLQRERTDLCRILGSAA